MSRLLYILSKEENGRSDEIFASVRQDMLSETVALTFDRRRGERRIRFQAVDGDRRGDDRRRENVADALDRYGWARVEVD